MDHYLQDATARKRRPESDAPVRSNSGAAYPCKTSSHSSSGPEPLDPGRYAGGAASATGRNLPLRTSTLLRMQGLHGNRALQRSLARTPVQRSFWEGAAGIVGGPLLKYALNPDTDVTQERRMAGAVHEEQKSYEGFIDSAEAGASGLMHGAADMVKDVPVIGGMAGTAADVGEQVIQFQGGAAKGTVGLMAGLASMALNPIDTIKGFGAIGRHMPTVPGSGISPRILSGGIGMLTGDKSPEEALDESVGSKAVNEDLGFWGQMAGHFLEPYGEAASKGKYAEMGGRAAVDIGSLILGLGEAGEGSKGAQGARAAGEGGEAGGAAGRTVGGDVSPTLRSPELPPAVPEGPATIPDGPPTIPDGPPSMPDGPGSLIPETRPSPVPMRRPIGFDRPLEPYLRPGDLGKPKNPIGFDGNPAPPTIPDWPPLMPEGPGSLAPETRPVPTPMRRPIGFDRGLEPYLRPGDLGKPRKPIGFDRGLDPEPHTMPDPPGAASGEPMRRPIGFDRPLEPLVGPRLPRKPIGFDRWFDLPEPSSLPGSWFRDMFGA